MKSPGRTLVSRTAPLPAGTPAACADATFDPPATSAKTRLSACAFEAPVKAFCGQQLAQRDRPAETARKTPRQLARRRADSQTSNAQWLRAIHTHGISAFRRALLSTPSRHSSWCHLESVPFRNASHSREGGNPLHNPLQMCRQHSGFPPSRE